MIGGTSVLRAPPIGLVGLVGLLLVSLLIGGCESPSPVDEFLKDPAALKRGKSIFVGTCGAYCHGMTPGPRDAPFLFDCVWLHGDRDEDLFAVISDGVPNTRMVSFGGALPEGDDDIWRVVAYLKSQRQQC